MVKYCLEYKNIYVELKGNIIVKEQSEFQYIIVVDNKFFGKMMLIGDDEDWVVQFSEKDEALYHEAIVHPVMALHPNPKRVLILGGGDGGVAREVLKHNVNQIQIVELDEKVIEISKKCIPIHQSSLDDSHVNITIADAREFIEKTDQKYDVIIFDLTDPEGPSKSLFTQEFYKEIKNHLTENGAIAVQTSSPALDPQVLGRVHAALGTLFSTVVAYSNFIPSFFVEESYCIATNQKINDISKILKQRQIELKSFTYEQLESLLKNPTPLVSKVLARKWEPSTAASPVTCSDETQS